MEKTGRNDPCYCGSGKKYKKCCGKISPETANTLLAGGFISSPMVDIEELKKKAVEEHAKGELISAVASYEQILRINSEDFDALHMLGVAKCQLDKQLEGVELMLKAVKLQTEEYLPLYQNLGKAIEKSAHQKGLVGKLLCPDVICLDRPLIFAKDQLNQLSGLLPLVSIVVPIYNHRRYVVDAIRSLYDQTYQRIEIILIDDGSTDDSALLVNEILVESPFPIVFKSRANKGAHVTINEAIGMANGEFIGILNSDDRYLPDRVENMARLLVTSDKLWGFSGLKLVDDDGRNILPGQNAYADQLIEFFGELDSEESITIGMANFNYAITTGNLFFSKSLWEKLGGFSNYRYVHDWDFCLRALELESPVVLREATYEYRLHETNTISETGGKAKRETLEMLGNWAKTPTPDIGSDLVRNQLICCARKRVLLATRNAHLLGKWNLITFANKLLSTKTQD